MARLIMGGIFTAILAIGVWALASLIAAFFRWLAGSQKPIYRFEDFLEDLKNPAVSLDAIIGKCGGTIPREWEDRISPPKPEEAQGVPPPPKDARQKNQDWWKQMAVKTPVIKVVPPPPQAQGKPQIQGWLIPCKWCSEGTMGFGRSSVRDRQGNIILPHCDRCNGSRMIMITGGGYRGGK